MSGRRSIKSKKAEKIVNKSKDLLENSENVTESLEDSVEPVVIEEVYVKTPPSKKTAPPKRNINLKKAKSKLPIDKPEEVQKVLEFSEEVESEEKETKPKKKVQTPSKKTASAKKQVVEESEDLEETEEIAKSEEVETPSTKKVKQNKGRSVAKPRQVNTSQSKLLEDSKLVLFTKLEKLHQTLHLIYEQNKIKPESNRFIKAEAKAFHKEHYDSVNLVIDKLSEFAFKAYCLSPKFKAFRINNHILEFLRSIDLGNSVSLDNKNNPLEELKDTPLSEVLFSVTEGIANPNVMKKITKLYVSLNKDQLAIDSETIKSMDLKGLAHNHNIMNDEMKQHLLPLIEKLNKESEGKEGDQRNLIGEDVISRQHLNKVFEIACQLDECTEEEGLRILDDDKLPLDSKVVEGLKNDDIILEAVLKYRNRVAAKEKNK